MLILLQAFQEAQVILHFLIFFLMEMMQKETWT